jgi:hypothetical protein
MLLKGAAIHQYGFVVQFKISYKKKAVEARSKLRRKVEEKN